jgi:hypothetical protein
MQTSERSIKRLIRLMRVIIDSRDLIRFGKRAWLSNIVAKFNRYSLRLVFLDRHG